MGDGQNGSAIFREVVLKPAEGFEIEMIGWLIKHQEIRFHDEQTGQMGTHDPSTTQCAGRDMDIPFTECQPAQDTLRLHLKRMSIQIGKTGDGFMMHGIILTGMFPLKTMHLLHLGGDIGGEFQNGFITRGGTLLRKEADRGVALHRDCPCIRRSLLEDQ